MEDFIYRREACTAEGAELPSVNTSKASWLFVKGIQARLPNFGESAWGKVCTPESNRALPSTNAHQKAGESLPELGQAIRRHANFAFPTAPTEIRKTLSQNQFVDALQDSEMRIRIKQTRPKYLDDAIQLAVELEANNRAYKRNYARPTTSETIDGQNSLLEELSAKFDSLQKEIRVKGRTSCRFCAIGE